MSKYSVYLGRCDIYNPDQIMEIISRAIREIPLEKPISGKVVIKPNVVMAHPKVATECYTRREVLDAILEVVERHGEDVASVDVVEKSGWGVTTASMFRWAGYRKLKKRHSVKLRPMEERPRRTVVLESGRMHHHLSVAKEMAERDFLIFAPRLKTNVLSHAYSGALKLNVGTIDSRERMYHHDRNLHVKIVDILEAANPDLIVTDGIRLSYSGNQMTQGAIYFGAVIVSTNAVAHDMVCAKLLNLDPRKIEHIKEAMDRGYGPTSFGQIEILGDYPVEKGHTIVKHLDFGFYPVEQFDCNFNIISGTPYCVGGCQGIFLDWLHMIKDRKPGMLKRFPKLTVLIGKVAQKIEDRTVLLVGDCAPASPGICAKRIVRIKGCPPTHKRIVLVMMLNFLLLAPLVRPSLIIDGFILYPLKKFKGWLMNLRYRPPISIPASIPVETVEPEPEAAE